MCGIQSSNSSVVAAEGIQMDIVRWFIKYRVEMINAIALFAIVSVTGCFSQKKNASALPGNSASATTSRWSGTHSVDVQDPVYGMTAFTINVPTGWKFAGRLLRPGGCHPAPTLDTSLSYISESPDGFTAYGRLPGTSWSWTSNGSNLTGSKCPSNIKINSAAGLLLNIGVPNLHPHAVSVAIAPISQQNQDNVKSENLRLQAQSGGYGRHYADMARVIVSYQVKGVDLEESIATMIFCNESQVMAMPTGLGGRPTPGYLKRNCYSTGTYIVRAPKGHIEEAMKYSPPPPQINAAWNNRVINNMRSNFQAFQTANDAQFKANQQYFAEQNQQLLQKGADFQDTMRDSTNRALSNDRNNQGAIDNAAHQTALYSLDQQTFLNPATGERIEASNQFNNQWLSSDGSTLIQTQDNSFDPNGSVYPVSQSWTQLVPTF